MNDLTLGLRIRVNDDGSVRVLNQIEDGIDNVAGSARRANDPVSALTTGIGYLQKAVAGVSVAVLAEEVFDVNKEFQSLRANLVTSVGSLENAGLAFSFVQEFAAKTPYDVEQVTESFITLKNLGLKPSEEALRSYGNISAAQTKPIMQMIEAVADAATGEFERLKEFGIKASQENGKVALTFQGQTTTITNSASEIEKYLINLGNNKFGDAMARQSETIDGAISNTSDTWNNFMDHILSDARENMIAKWVRDAGDALHWLDVQMNGAISNTDKLAAIDQRINANKASLAAHRSNGMLGSLVDDLAGYDPQLKKNQIESDLRAREKLTQAITEQQTAQKGLLDAMGKTDTASAKSVETKKAAAAAAKEVATEAKKHAGAIANEVAALNDQHQKLTLSERDYQLSKFAALGMTDAVKASSIAIWDANKAIEVQKKGIDAGKSAMDAEIERYNKLTQSVNEFRYSQLLLDGVSPGNAINIVGQASVSDDIEKRIKSIDDARSALENYNKTVADTTAKTSDLGSVTSAIFDGALGGVNSLAGAFDNMINSIDKSTIALEENRAAKIEIDNFQPSLDRDQYLKDLKIKQDALDKNAKDELRINSEIVNEKISGTRQIAGAVSSMLKRGSTEQKAAHAIEMGLAGAQIAMQFMKITGIGAVTAAEMASVPPIVAATGLKTTAKFGETWATEQQLFAISSVTAAETASVGPSVAASTAKGTSKAAEAVATQATAGPYIGFALMAAMAAAMAAIGFGVGGGKSASAPPPTSPDSGTILGDKTAKSESVNNVYQLLKDIHADEYAELQGINEGVKALNSGITNVITRLFQGGGLKIPAIDTSSKLVGLPATLNAIDPGHFLRDIDPIGSAIFGALFGGKQKREVVGGGIATADTAIQDLFDNKNLKAYQYTTVKTSTSRGLLGGLFGGKKPDRYDDVPSAIDPSVQKAMNDIFSVMGDSMVDMAKIIGKDTKAKIEDYVIPAMKIELYGLNGEDAIKKFNGVISTALDTMSNTVFGDVLRDYQGLGEGMYETAGRIVTEITVVKEALSATVQSVSGDVIFVSDNIAKLSGGIAEFQKQHNQFYDKFYTDSEKQDRLAQKLSTQLSAVFPESAIQTLLTGRDEYRKLITSIGDVNEGNYKQYQLMIQLAGSADDYYSSLEAVKKKTRDLTIELLEAQGQTDKALAMRKEDALKGASAEDAALQQQIWSTQELIKTQTLNAEMMELTGNITEAVAYKRNQELAALSGTDQAIQKKIYRLQDEAKTVALEIQLLEAEGKVRGNEAKLLDATRAKREQELAATDKFLIALKKQLFITQDLAAATDKLQAAMKKNVDLNVQLLNELGQSYAAEQLSRSQTLQDMNNDLVSAQTTVADAVANLNTATDHLSSVTETLSTSVATTGNYTNYSNEQIKQFIKDNNLTTVDQIVAGVNKYNVNPLQVGSIYGLSPGETASIVQKSGATLNPAPYTEYTPEQIRQYITDAGLTTVKDIFAAAQKYNADPYKVGAAYGWDKAATQSALKDAGINLVDIPGFTELLANQKDLTAQVGGLTKVVDTGNKTVSTIKGNINTQQAIYDAKDAKIKAGLDIELLNAQGKAYDALAITRQNELKALSPANQELKKQIYTLQDAAKTQSLQIELLNAQGRSYEALALSRNNELKALSATDAAIKSLTHTAIAANTKIDVLRVGINPNQRDTFDRIQAQNKIAAVPELKGINTREDWTRLANTINPATPQGQRLADLMKDLAPSFELAQSYKEGYTDRYNKLDRQVKFYGNATALRADERLNYLKDNGMWDFSSDTKNTLGAKQEELWQKQDAEEKRVKLLNYETDLLETMGLSYDAFLLKRQEEKRLLSTEDAAKKEAIYAAQDAAKTRGLEIELLNLSGASVKALAMTREDELKGLSSTDQAIKKHIYTLQDLATAADKAKTATGTAMSVLQKSVEAERKTITDTYNAGVKNTQDAIDTLTASTEKLKGLSSSLKGFLDKLTVPGNEAYERSFAQAQIAAAIQLAKTAGASAITNQDALVKAIDVLGRPSENLFGSAVDFERDLYRTSISIAELSALTDAGLNVDEKQLKALQTGLDNDKKLYEGEMTRLDDVVAHAQAQIDAINGTTIAVMSVKDAIANLSTAVAVQQAVQASQQIAARDAALSVGATSGSYTTTEMYDPSTGMTTVTTGGWSADRIPGFATGGQHDGGWRIVGENGPELEYTGPSRIFSNPQSQSLVDNSDLIAELRELRAAYDRQQAILDRIERSTGNTAVHTKKSADILDNNTAGGGPSLVKVVS